MVKPTHTPPPPEWFLTKELKPKEELDDLRTAAQAVVEPDVLTPDQLKAQVDAAFTRTPQRVFRLFLQLFKDRTGRVYVAGPMTGLPDLNFPAFHAAAAQLRAQGLHVENPAEHGEAESADWDDYLRYDLGRLATCSAIYLLPGWENSKGAQLEVHVARTLDMAIMYAPGAMSVLQAELRKKPVPVVASRAAPAADEWAVRGELAASLTCWPRLTGNEAAELVALCQRLAAPRAEA